MLPVGALFAFRDVDWKSFRDVHSREVQDGLKGHLWVDAPIGLDKWLGAVSKTHVLLAAQELAGYASPATTRRYTKITPAELKKHFDDSDRQERGTQGHE